MEEQMSNSVKIIEYLQRVHDKPLQVMLNDPNAACNFLTGFTAACRLLDARLGKERPASGEKYREIRYAVLRERGWRIDPYTPWKEMQERGMDNVAMMQEGIDIEIEVIKRLYETQW